MALVLYNAKQSTCSQKVRLCLAEKGLDFEEHILDLFSGDQLKPEYLSINPNGVVPTLVHDGQPIVDSSVIAEYLDDVFPEISVRPKDSVQMASMRAWMRFFEEVPAPAIRVPSYNNVFLRNFNGMSDEEFKAFGEAKPLRKQFFLKMGRTGYPPEEVDQALERLQLTVDRMALTLQNSPWLAGESYSLADMSIVPVIARMNDIGLAKLWRDVPAVVAWFDRVRDRASYAQAFYPGAMLSEQYPELNLQSG